MTYIANNVKAKNDDKCDVIGNNFNERDNFVNAKEIGTDFTYKHEVMWEAAIGFIVWHLLVVWGLAVIIMGGVCLKTLLWCFIIHVISSQGVTVGAHRYFTHRSFKATPLLRALLLFAHLMSGHFSMFHWCLLHRQHHRYTDTDGDPHNATRGFFFSHLGWLVYKRHPYAKELGRRIDMSDLESDWMVMFQKKYYIYLFFVFSVLVPVWVPVHFFGESILNSFLVCFIVRYFSSLHIGVSGNSFAHLYGTRPYDKKMRPVDTWFLHLLTLGEGWHNYHHAFPWDYKSSEVFDFNLSAKTIRLCEKLGLAYDLKTATPEQVKNRILQSGDGTHHLFGNDEARAQVTAKVGPVHPLNPFYNIPYSPANSALKNTVDICNNK